MKTKQYLSTAIAFAMIVFFGGVTTCAAQINGSEQFVLYSDFASNLGMSQQQIDTFNKILLPQNYDWNEAIDQIALLEEEILNAENNTSQSPEAIGNTVAQLVQQKVTIARAIIAEVQVTNKNLFNLLTTAQQYQLGNILNGVQNALTVLNMNSDAFTANLSLSQYSVTGLDNYINWNDVPSPPVSQTQVAALNRMLGDAVARKRTERANAQALAARQKRIAGSQR